jgi:hypothetical protein
MGHIAWILFGPSTWGAGGNMVAWVICGCLGFGWLHSKEKARHLARMAQAQRHHAAVMAAIAGKAQNGTDVPSP